MSSSPQEIEISLNENKVSAIQQALAIGRNPCLVLVRNSPVKQPTTPCSGAKGRVCGPQRTPAALRAAKVW
jgi:non-canonical (house-cleaning) NTP pyrophosphatase